MVDGCDELACEVSRHAIRVLETQKGNATSYCSQGTHYVIDFRLLGSSRPLLSGPPRPPGPTEVMRLFAATRLQILLASPIYRQESSCKPTTRSRV